jgi:hypothetical protein
MAMQRHLVLWWDAIKSWCFEGKNDAELFDQKAKWQNLPAFGSFCFALGNTN